jgi:Predicted esterase
MGHQGNAPYPQGILIDQGLADQFLATQLHPHLFESACAQVGQPLTLRRHAGYDHGYYFIQPSWRTICSTTPARWPEATNRF